MARTTVRLLESLIRLSEAHARLMCHNKVQIMDAVIAILCVSFSQNKISLLGKKYDLKIFNLNKKLFIFFFLEKTSEVIKSNNTDSPSLQYSTYETEVFTLLNYSKEKLKMDCKRIENEQQEPRNSPKSPKVRINSDFIEKEIAHVNASPSVQTSSQSFCSQFFSSSKPTQEIILPSNDIIIKQEIQSEDLVSVENISNKSCFQVNENSGENKNNETFIASQFQQNPNKRNRFEALINVNSFSEDPISQPALHKPFHRLEQTTQRLTANFLTPNVLCFDDMANQILNNAIHLNKHGPVSHPDYCDLNEITLPLKTQADFENYPHESNYLENQTDFCSNDFLIFDSKIESNSSIHIITSTSSTSDVSKNNTDEYQEREPTASVENDKMRKTPPSQLSAHVMTYDIDESEW